MGLFDALRSRPAAESTSASSPGDVAAMEEELSAAAAAATASADAAATLASMDPSGGGRLYNPYEGLATAMDGRGLRGTYRLPTQVRDREMGERLFFFRGRCPSRRSPLGALPRWRLTRAGTHTMPTPGRGRGMNCTFGWGKKSPKVSQAPACACVKQGGRCRTRALAAPSHKKPLHFQPEFLFSEEAAVHRRSWSENLTYYTGAGYLAGAALGGSQGAAAALRAGPPASVATTAGGPTTTVFTDTPRLRVNRLLNTAGRAGRGAGNAAGALGLLFSATESAALGVADGRVPDALPTVGAGFLTGALFRSPRGPRTAVVAGVLGSVAAGALAAARAHINPNL